MQYRNIIFYCVLSTLIHVFLAPNMSYGDYFIDCESAFDHPEYKDLKVYVEAHSDLNFPGMCFKMNKNEFITVSEGGARAEHNIYLFNAMDNTYGPIDESIYYPGINVVKEFTGKIISDMYCCRVWTKGPRVSRNLFIYLI